MSDGHGSGGCGGQGPCGCGGQTPAATASVNGLPLHGADEALAEEELRERAWTELLRQEAVRQGLLPDVLVLRAPVLTSAEEAVIEAMVEHEVPTRQPSREEALRYYEGHQERFVEGAKAWLRHILFAVTDGVPVPALAARAEQALLELTRKDASPQRFGELARELSNCPTGAHGGELGWLGPRDIAPELAQELFHAPGALRHVGLKPRLLHSRFGFHILDVRERRPGRLPAFEEVRERIALQLAQQNRARALHQYIRLLAGRSVVEGVELETADSPLLQ